MKTQRNTVSIIDIKKMMTAVHHWLNYTHQTSRIDILEESSLKTPITAYLERNTKDKQCYMERLYSKFTTLKLKAPKKIDIMWEDEIGDCLIELKYVGEGTCFSTERQRYFNDIVRLSLALKNVKDPQKKRSCYLVVGGISEIFEYQLKGLTIPVSDKGNVLDKQKPTAQKRDTIFNRWLNFNETQNDKNEKTIKISFPKRKNNKLAPYFSDFIKEYFKLKEKLKNEKDMVKISLYKDLFPETIQTKQVCLIDGKDCGGQTLGLWEILI